MNIVFASSEVVPFSKTGGLADVSGALPIALEKLGANCTVFTPAYKEALTCGQDIQPTEIHFEVPLGDRLVSGRLLKSNLPGSTVPVYLVDQPDFFDRDGLYGNSDGDHPDNDQRFIFFSRAVLQCIKLLKIPCDVVHANDWQTGLIPALLANEFQAQKYYQSMTSLFTIHNMAYQGWFGRETMNLTGLDWKLFNWQQLECHGQINMLKAGLIFADWASTVSPTYSQEIQSEPLGCGMSGVLTERKESLSGIINGIDQSAWDPENDPHLWKPYGKANWKAGKKYNKEKLQALAGLPVSSHTPVIGSVGRLVEQKGWDLVIDILPKWLESKEVQWIILGTGDPVIESKLRGLSELYPSKISLLCEFSNKLAHRIEAGSDIFLMPSKYEPCGLNQFYSLRYGSVPVVRETGGLADSVTDFSAAGGDGSANGFSFLGLDASQLNDTLARAMSLWNDDPAAWNTLVETGMTQDWSWSNSAEKYMQLYRQTIARRNQIETPENPTSI